MTTCPCAGPLLLNAAAVADALTIDLDAAEGLIASGALASVTVAGEQRITRADLKRFVEALPRQATEAPERETTWLTQAQLARRVGLSHSTIVRLVRLGRLPHHDVGGGGGRRRDGIRFAPEDVASIETGAHRPQIEYSLKMAELKAGRRAWTPDLRHPPPIPETPDAPPRGR